jgi:flagellar hook-associated protein 3 FlgL
VQVSDGRFVATGDSGAEVFQRIPAGNGTFTLAIAPANTGGLLLGAGTVANPAAWLPDTYTIDFPTPDTYRVLNGSNAEIVAPTPYVPGQDIAFLGVNVELSGAPAAGDSFTVAPSSARDVFATVDDLIRVLEQPATGTTERALMHSRIGQLLADVDRATEHVIDRRSEIGARARALDQEESLNGAEARCFRPSSRSRSWAVRSWTTSAAMSSVARLAVLNRPTCAARLS